MKDLTCMAIQEVKIGVDTEETKRQQKAMKNTKKKQLVDNKA